MVKYTLFFGLGMLQGAIMLDWYKAKREAKKLRKYAPVKKINVV